MKPEADQVAGKTAVALQFDGVNAPLVVAKGQGLTGEQILKLASENGVPLYENAALAAALANIPLGDAIPRELYLAVAEILAFVYYLDEIGESGVGLHSDLHA